MIDPRLMPNNEEVATLITTRLIVQPNGKLNKPLLDFLKSYGLTLLYLFDDYAFTTKTLKNQLKIWLTLNDMGFFVIGSLTPQDLAWYEMFVSKKKHLPKSLQLAFQTPGGAFKEAIEHIYTSPRYQLPGETEVGSALIRHAVQRLAKEKGLPHVKALMLQFFLSTLSFRTNRILILDDDPTLVPVFDAVKRSNKKIESPPIATITLPRESQSDAFYFDQIIKHPLIAINTIKKALFDRRYELSYNSTNPFLKSSKHKQEVLSALSHAIEFNHHNEPKTVSSLMDECLADSIFASKPPKVPDIPTYAKLQKKKKSRSKQSKVLSNQMILSQQRNIFASSPPKEEPKTLSLIKLIRKTFGDVKVPSIHTERIVPQPYFFSRTQPTVISPVQEIVNRQRKKPKRSVSAPSLF